MPFTELAASHILAANIKSSYQEVRPWEVALYKRLGIETFASIIRSSLVSSHKRRQAQEIGTNNYYLHANTTSDFEHFKQYTLYNEKVHLPLTILGTVLFTQGIIEYPNIIGCGIIGAGTVANLYCTMLQRYNRARIDKILQWKRAKDENK